jgi:hypothetical protein
MPNAGPAVPMRGMKKEDASAGKKPGDKDGS